jgi:hypothetical protein
MKAKTNSPVTTPEKEVYLKLDSRNRVTIKSPIATIYAAEVNEVGVVTLVPCKIQKQPR